MKNRNRIQLYKPQLDDLWFRQSLMADPETMSYNKAWGGTIPFPEEKWKAWHDFWMNDTDGRHFYRYVTMGNSRVFIGEAAYHYDETEKIWLADVIIMSRYRGHGYGSEALRLLCEAAKKNGLLILRDHMAIDNHAMGMFLRAGFEEEYRTKEIIMLKKALNPDTPI
ncbi:MAG: GNAT family N-acetyltransferase [Clostridia bacterium]|nr:GNAT family N-acetyltransferase [Clostridia bacterium]